MLSNFYKKESLLFLIILLFSIHPSFSQEIHNRHSLKPIRKDDIMFQKQLWFRLDLRQKSNAPLFTTNQEITRVIIDAVKQKRITPYANDSLNRILSQEEFLSRLQMSSAEEDIYEEEDQLNWSQNQESQKQKTESYEYLPKQLYFLDIKEYYIFNKIISRMYHDPIAITITISAEQTPTGLERTLASFSYKEVMNNLFNDKENGEWVNPQNSAENRSIAEAFELRLFNARLIKYENPRDNTIEDIYGEGKRSLIKADEYIYKLIEYEALLWSY